MSAKRKGVTKTTGEADVPTTATVAETAAKAARAAADHQRIDLLAKAAWSRRIRDAWRSVFG